MFSIFPIFILGVFLARPLLKTSGVLETLSLGFLLALPLLTISLFLVGYFTPFQLDWQISWIVYLLLLMFVLMIFRSCRPPPMVWSSPGYFFAIISIGIMSAASQTRRVITDWDAVTLYDFRARVLLLTGSIHDTLFRAPILDYPYFTTLSHFWIYLNGEYSPLPIYPILLLCFSVVIYYVLLRNSSRLAAFLGTLTILCSPKLFDQSFVAYANLPYTIYLVLGSIFLHRWIEFRHTRDLTLGVVLGLLSFWVRGFPFAVINLLVVVFMTKTIRKFTLPLLFASLPFASLYLGQLNIQLLAEVVGFFRSAILDYYFPYYLLFILTLIFQVTSKQTNYYLPIVIIGQYLTMLAGNYYYALSDPHFASIPDAAQRTTMFINPMISYYTVTVLLKTKRFK